MVKDQGQRGGGGPSGRGSLPSLPGGPPPPPVGLPPLPGGLPDDERHRTATALHSAALRLLRVARTADGVLDLDGPRASLLSVLVFAGPLPVTRLATLEQVSPPAITKTVAALEAAGLAERTRSDSDRRVVLVSATEAGRQLLERGRAARVRMVAELFADASEGELAVLRGAAELIAAELVAAQSLADRL